jgi:hypothetical protein
MGSQAKEHRKLEVWPFRLQTQNRIDKEMGGDIGSGFVGQY